MKESRGEYVALRKVTVIIKNGTRRVVVKALLDDASRKTYINSDVAAELGLQGENSRVTVNVLNGQTDSLETKIFELNLQSWHEKIHVKIAAFTKESATGNIWLINWAKYAKKWEHLKGITLPWTTPNRQHFHRWQLVRDAREKPRKTVAWLTALGWTCIGNPNGTDQGGYRWSFAYTYFIRAGDKSSNYIVNSKISWR